MSKALSSLEQAFECHRNGDLQGAANLCRAILKDEPENSEALHLLGIALSESGLFRQAIEFFEKAIAIGGPNSSVLHNYGLALLSIGDAHQAARAFQHAANAAPLQAQSWYHLGEAQLLRDQPGAAIEAFNKNLELEPEHVKAKNLLGVALRKVGRLSDSRAVLQAISQNDLKDAAVQNNLGITETELGALEEAKLSFQAALSIAPNYVEAHFNLGNVYLGEQSFSLAAECFEAARDLDPNNASVICHLAICRQKARDFEGALALLDSLINSAEVSEADLFQALGGRANVYCDLGRFAEALADIETVLMRQPDNIVLLANKALTLQHTGDLAGSISVYRQAMALAPDNEPIATNFAQALLLDGQFEEGWRAFEERLTDAKIVAKRDELPGINWRGEDLSEKHLLLWCEQGIGDTIQFIRYLPLVEPLAAEVTLVGPDRLLRIMSGVETASSMIAESSPLPSADYNAPLMSLPNLLQRIDIPSATSYLAADQELIAHWAEKLGPKKNLRIGIAWQGNPNYDADHQRSIPLVHMKPLFARENIQFVNLQKGYGIEQLAGLDLNLVDLTKDMDNEDAFTDTAAVMAQLDLVITSDTAIPHLAGALGVPTWLLLPHTPDWRWLRKRSDSPWYPSMQLFRQAAPNDWPSVIDQVLVALDQLEGLR